MWLDHRTGFGCFFLAGGVLGLAGGVELIFKQVALWRRAVRVEAEVTSVRAETWHGDDGDQSTFYLPTVSFTTGGARVRAEVVAGRRDPKAFRRGQKLKVYYDPRDPRSIALRRRDWPGGLLAALLAGVSTAIGLALLRT